MSEMSPSTVTPCGHPRVKAGDAWEECETCKALYNPLPLPPSPYNWPKLREPFAEDEIEWRVGHAGQTGSKIWALALAYITNRVVMDRLDDVFGPVNWRNDYSAGVDGGIMCMLSVRIGDEWLTKMDGAPATDMEAVKGGLSAAMKRAAVQWGIGRYLYGLTDNFAKVHDKGKLRGQFKDDKKQVVRFKWDPPKLPAWALPARAEKAPADDENKQQASKKGSTGPSAARPSHPDPDDVLDKAHAGKDELTMEVAEIEVLLEKEDATDKDKAEIVRRASKLPAGAVRKALSDAYMKRWPS